MQHCGLDKRLRTLLPSKCTQHLNTLMLPFLSYFTLSLRTLGAPNVQQSLVKHSLTCCGLYNFLQTAVQIENQTMHFFKTILFQSKKVVATFLNHGQFVMVNKKPV